MLDKYTGYGTVFCFVYFHTILCHMFDGVFVTVVDIDLFVAFTVYREVAIENPRWEAFVTQTSGSLGD